MVLFRDSITVFTRIRVTVFDEKPVIPVAAATLAILTHAHQHPAALQLLAREGEFQLALAQSLFRINTFFRHPEAPVPQHDGAATIFALRNRAFKVAVVEWMILDLDGQAPIAWIERRPLRDGPGLENAIDLQPQIVVKPGGSMLLDDEAGILSRLDPRLPARLRGFREVALGLIERKLASGADLTFATHPAASSQSECQIQSSTRNLYLLVVL